MRIMSILRLVDDDKQNRWMSSLQIFCLIKIVIEWERTPLTPILTLIQAQLYIHLFLYEWE